MQFGLTARVVVTVVLLAVGVVALDALVTRWAFESRFLDYVSEQERELLGDLAEVLAREHGSEGDLEALGDRRTLLRFMGRALVGERLAQARLSRFEGGPDEPSAPEPGTREPPRGDWREGPPPEVEDRSRRGRERLEHDLRRRLGSFVPRLRIRLADGRALLEPRLDPPARVRLLRQDVVVDGATVATLELVPLRELARDRDRRFARDHRSAIGWIAVVAALVACVVGWLLARRLLGPVQAVAAGARALAAGEHDVELPEDRRDELGDLARDFNILARTLAATARARERWMADVAHELRTPAAVLRAEIDALRDGVRPLEPAALESLDAEVTRLARLVDDLHDLTLADAGALAHHFEETDLAALLDQACARYRDRLTAAGLELQWTRPADAHPCEADPRRLDQLLANLLENALRYTDPPGPVRVSLSRDGSRAHICIEDGPPGVEDGELGRLFERFHRVEASRSRASGGAGLGLAIAERIAAAHGGTISARPSALGGLAVDVLLPLARGA